MISIQERYRPFSHKEKVKCLLPRTNLVVQGSPEKIQIGDFEVYLGQDPYVKGFTQQMDLEKDCIWVFGKGFRIKVFATKNGVYVGDRFFPMKLDFFEERGIERLFLGVHKSQDWELITRRMDPKEIYPILYHLAQKVPHSKGSGGTFEYRDLFNEMLVPVNENALKIAFETIRATFILEKEKSISLLPENPFVSGRMQNVQTAFGNLDMLWSKHTLQRVTLHVQKASELLFNLPDNLKSFRIKKSLNDRGKIHRKEEILYLEKGTLYLDRFYL